MNYSKIKLTRRRCAERQKLRLKRRKWLKRWSFRPFFTILRGEKHPQNVWTLRMRSLFRDYDGRETGKKRSLEALSGSDSYHLDACFVFFVTKTHLKYFRFVFASSEGNKTESIPQCKQSFRKWWTVHFCEYCAYARASRNRIEMCVNVEFQLYDRSYGFISLLLLFLFIDV